MYDIKDFTSTILSMLTNYQLRTSLINYVSCMLEIDVTSVDIEYLVTYWNEYLYDMTSNYINERKYNNLDDIVISAILENRKEKF